MSTPPTLSHRRNGLDTKVWTVMMVTCFLSLGLLSYRFVFKSEPCVPASVTINAVPAEKISVHFAEQPLTFKIPMAANKNVRWNFGDKSPAEEGFIVTHTFKEEGDFTVMAMINDRCENMARVTIKRRPESNQTLNNYNISEKILGSTIVTVGKEEQFSFSTPEGAFEWTVKNSSNFPTQKTPSANFKFLIPGAYTIQLVLNNDPTKKGYKEITVVEDIKALSQKNQGKSIPILMPRELPPLPTPKDRGPEKTVEKQQEAPVEKEPEKKPEVTVEAPAKPKILNVSNGIFQSLLEALVEGQKEVSDFDSYLPYGGGTKVKVNDEKTYKTFKQFGEEIRGKKKVVIQSVELLRDDNNQIQQMRIKYKKKWF